MPTIENYEDHEWCVKNLKMAQEADYDNREAAREAALFLAKRNGQWEQLWWDAADKRPRYTFDMTTPIVDQVAGAIERTDFSIKVSPASGQASKEAALLYDDLIRNIENISSANTVYGLASRSMVVKGIDGWRVKTDYVEGDSFDQDLIIEQIPDFIDHCWFGPHTKPDASDAKYAWVLNGMTPDDFKLKYPEAGEIGVSENKPSNAYFYREDLIMVGEFLYLKPKEVELALMSSGIVVKVDDDYKSVKDDLAKMGVTEVRRRKRTQYCVHSRMFSDNEWLSAPRETVFYNWLPIVPVYGNFDYFDDKIIYFGAVEKLIDPQRVLNYSISREVEEGALAPRAKYWMTAKQVSGHEAKIATLNTNSDPVQLFNPDERLPGPPVQVGGAQINQGLRAISEAMQGMIGVTAGMYAANMGDNPGLQSGVAIEALQTRGDQGSNKYITAREIAQAHTGKILVDAIPRVYTPGRQVRLLGEDGSQKMYKIGVEVIDNQTGELKVINNMESGIYDVVCTSGPSFRSKQSETVKALVEVGSVDPSLMEISGDVLLSSIGSPGMSDVAARKRLQLFNAGIIPQSQLTEEELAMQQQAQQNQQPDAMMVAAMAEQKKAEADMLAQQNKQLEIQIKAQAETAAYETKQKELQISAYKAETERYKAEVDAQKVSAEIEKIGIDTVKAAIQPIQ